MTLFTEIFWLGFTLGALIGLLVGAFFAGLLRMSSDTENDYYLNVRRSSDDEHAHGLSEQDLNSDKGDART